MLQHGGQTAAQFLKRDRFEEKPVTAIEKLDRSAAFIRDPRELLIEKLSKPRTVGAPNTAALCCSIRKADDVADAGLTRDMTLDDLKRMLAYAEGTRTVSPGDPGFDPLRSVSTDLARELHNALVSGNDDGVAAILTRIYTSEGGR